MWEREPLSSHLHDMGTTDVSAVTHSPTPLQHTYIPHSSSSYHSSMKTVAPSCDLSVERTERMELRFSSLSPAGVGDGG